MKPSPASVTKVTSIDNATSLAIETAINDACQKAVEKVEQRNKAVLLRLIREVSDMRKEIAELKNAISPLEQETILPKEPFDNLYAFMQFEKQLENNDETLRVLKANLKKLSSLNSKKFVTTAWRRLLTDDAAQKLCWRGTEEKLSVKSLTVAMAIRDVFIHENGGVEEDFVAGSKSFFQFAKTRQSLKDSKKDVIIIP